MTEEEIVAEVRRLAAELAAAGHKVSADLCVIPEVAALVVQRKLRTLRNFRYACTGPRWEVDAHGNAWYPLRALVEWKHDRAPEIGFRKTVRPLRMVGRAR